MTTEISNRDHIIDSRDVIENIAELQESLQEEIVKNFEMLPLHEPRPDDLDLDNADSVEALTGVDESEQQKLVELLRLQEDCKDYARSWRNGVTLVRWTYFEAYAQELAQDMGAMTAGDQWPYTHIDWEAAAEELKQDYSEVDYAGEAYWVRSE